MSGFDLVVRGRRVVMAGGIAPAAVLVRSGLIAAIAGYDDEVPAAVEHDAGDAVVMAGLVDTHVHVNEPGRTDWEGFETATRAAAAGGVTTIVDMPLNSDPVTTTVRALEVKRDSVCGKAFVDVAFWGGLVPDNLDALEPLREAGVVGFKCFLVPSGLDAFPPVDEGVLRKAMPVLARLDVPLLVHAELPGPIEAAWKELAESGADGRSYANWLYARPRAAENEAIALVLRLARATGARVHIVHLSSSDALPMLRDAKTAGVRVTVETAPHYLHFASEDIRAGATELKCAPPIRERENRDALWGGLGNGTIDLIATDHSPCPPEMKKQREGDFAAAWGGIASLQLALPVVWRGARQRGYTVEHVAKWLSAAPSELAGLTHRKGALAPGRDADIVVWDPDAEFLVRPTDLQQRHSISPYDGARLPGVVRATFLRGTAVYRDGAITGDPRGAAVRGRAG